MIVDVGTGGGGAVLRAARRDAAALVIGVDTDPAAMREASRRAASAPRRGGLPNAIFLAGDIHGLPAVLDGRVDELRITLPWGSLLRAVVRAEPSFVSRVKDLLKPSGLLRVLVSVTERERGTGLDLVDRSDPSELACRYDADGLMVVDARPATEADVIELGSAWAKRLGIPRRRPATTVRLRKRDPASGNPGAG